MYCFYVIYVISTICIYVSSSFHDKPLRQMKKFIVELMNQLPYFTTQSINQYGGLKKSDESFFLSSTFFFSRENCI